MAAITSDSRQAHKQAMKEWSEQHHQWQRTFPKESDVFYDRLTYVVRPVGKIVRYEGARFRLLRQLRDYQQGHKGEDLHRIANTLVESAATRLEKYTTHENQSIALLEKIPKTPYRALPDDQKQLRDKIVELSDDLLHTQQLMFRIMHYVAGPGLTLFERALLKETPIVKVRNFFDPQHPHVLLRMQVPQFEQFYKDYRIILLDHLNYLETFIARLRELSTHIDAGIQLWAKRPAHPKKE
jgi:hypothetical protein